MKLLHLLFVILLPLALGGCGAEFGSDVSNADAAASQEPDYGSADQQQAEAMPVAEPENELAPGVLDQAAELLRQAAESTGDGSAAGRQWLSEKLQQASDSGSAISGDASEWVNKTYEALRDQGLTTADDARQWLTDDIRNMNAFEYRVVRISLDNIEAAEEKLNRLGQQRWECFHAVDRDGGSILLLKRKKRSILRNVPIRDMMKLIPLMGSEETGELP